MGKISRQFLFFFSADAARRLTVQMPITELANIICRCTYLKAAAELLHQCFNDKANFRVEKCIFI